MTLSNTAVCELQQWERPKWSRSPGSFEKHLQPTMRSIDSNYHFYSTTPARWADLVKYISVLTNNSP